MKRPRGTAMVNAQAHDLMSAAADADDALEKEAAKRERLQARAQTRAAIGAIKQAIAESEGDANRLRYRERELRLGPEELAVRGGQRIKIRGKPATEAADALRPQIEALDQRLNAMRAELAVHEGKLKDYQ